MNEDLEDIDLIERYLEGKLNEAELRSFNDRLDDDREFARKVRIRKAFPSLVKDSGEPVKNAVAEPPASGGNHNASQHKAIRLNSRVLLLIFIAAVLATVIFLIVRPGFRGMKQEIRVFNSFTTKDSAREQEKEPVESKAVTTDAGAPIVPEVPEREQSFSRNEEILFQWRQTTDSLTNFYIFSPSLKKMLYWKGIKPGIREFLLPSRTFIPGRYYWYVGSREYGRFFVITE